MEPRALQKRSAKITSPGSKPPCENRTVVKWHTTDHPQIQFQQHWSLLASESSTLLSWWCWGTAPQPLACSPSAVARSFTPSPWQRIRACDNGESLAQEHSGGWGKWSGSASFRKLPLCAVLWKFDWGVAHSHDELWASGLSSLSLGLSCPLSVLLVWQLSILWNEWVRRNRGAAMLLFSR